MIVLALLFTLATTSGCVGFGWRVHFSLSPDQHVVVVGGRLIVLVMEVLVRVILLVVGKVGVEREALSEVLGGFKAANVLEEVEIAESVNACVDEFVPVDALQAQVSVVLLEREVKCVVEVDIWTLNRVHLLDGRQLELGLVEVFGENSHDRNLIIN